MSDVINILYSDESKPIRLPFVQRVAFEIGRSIF